MTDWRNWVEGARAADIKIVADDLGISLKKIASNEWAGACPIDGGHDRFSINTRKRLFNCRGAEGGDVIALVEHCTGCSFIEAVERITGEPRPDRSRDETMEERASRMRRNEERLRDARAREAQERKADALRARRDEEAVADVLDRAIPLEQSKHGMAYLKEGRGLNPPKRFLSDLKYVAALDYWGPSDNGSGEIRLLATVPAVIAIIRDYSSAIIGISQTYLDPKEPKKWTPAGHARNSPKKIRGQKKGGLIRLGRITENLGLAEGWENALAWHQLGGGLHIEDLSLAAAVDIGNMAGGHTGVRNHPWRIEGDGSPTRIPNGSPNLDAPGAIIPDGVRNIIMICDANSEVCATAAHYMVGAKRFIHHGMTVGLAWPQSGYDWNEMVFKEIDDEKARREEEAFRLRYPDPDSDRPQGGKDTPGNEDRPQA